LAAVTCGIEGDGIANSIRIDLQCRPSRYIRATVKNLQKFTKIENVNFIKYPALYFCKAFHFSAEQGEKIWNMLIISWIQFYVFIICW